MCLGCFDIDTAAIRFPAVWRYLISANLAHTTTESSDLFVEIELDGDKRETRVIHNSQNPEWNETLEFEVKSDSKLQLQATCYDRYSTHRFHPCSLSFPTSYWYLACPHVVAPIKVMAVVYLAMHKMDACNIHYIVNCLHRNRLRRKGYLGEVKVALPDLMDGMYNALALL